MKSLEKALVLFANKPDDFDTNLRVISLLKAASEKSDDLEQSLDQAVELLGKIRYCNWPQIGLGINLNPQEIDQVLAEAEAALRSARRSPKNRDKKLIVKSDIEDKI